jgi:hypothetical protein
LRFTLLLAEVPEVVEADLNPVRCMTSGCLVLDMRLRIEHRRLTDRVKTQCQELKGCNGWVKGAGVAGVAAGYVTKLPLERAIA